MLPYVNVQLTMKTSIGRIFMTTRSLSGFSLLLLTTTTPVEDILTFPIGADTFFYERMPLALTDRSRQGWKRLSIDRRCKIVFNMYYLSSDGHERVRAIQELFHCAASRYPHKIQPSHQVVLQSGILVDCDYPP